MARTEEGGRTRFAWFYRGDKERLEAGRRSRTQSEETKSYEPQKRKVSKVNRAGATCGTLTSDDLLPRAAEVEESVAQSL